MEAVSKLPNIDVLYSTLKRKFERGEPDYCTIIAYNSAGQQVDILLNYRNGDRGLDLIKKELDLVATERPDIAKIEIRTYSSEKSPAHKHRLSYEVDMSKPIVLQQETIENEPQLDRSLPDLESGLSGVGGITGYLEKLYSTDHQLKIALYEKEKLEKELAELKAEYKALDKENDDLNDANNKLLEKLNELKKYDPDGHTIFGVNTVGLLSRVAENTLTGLVRNNPKLGQSLMGVDGYNQFVNQAKLESQPQAQHQPTEVEIETNDEANLSPQQKQMLQYVKSVFEWLKSLKAEDLQKFAFILDYYKEDFKKADELINFINNQNNQ